MNKIKHLLRVDFYKLAMIFIFIAAILEIAQLFIAVSLPHLLIYFKVAKVISCIIGVILFILM